MNGIFCIEERVRDRGLESLEDAVKRLTDAEKGAVDPEAIYSYFTNSYNPSRPITNKLF
jgi:hypothetical protein